MLFDGGAVARKRKVGSVIARTVERMGMAERE